MDVAHQHGYSRSACRERYELRAVGSDVSRAGRRVASSSKLQQFASCSSTPLLLPLPHNTQHHHSTFPRPRLRAHAAYHYVLHSRERMNWSTYEEFELLGCAAVRGGGCRGRSPALLARRVHCKSATLAFQDWCRNSRETILDDRHASRLLAGVCVDSKQCICPHTQLQRQHARRSET